MNKQKKIESHIKLNFFLGYYSKNAYHWKAQNWPTQFPFNFLIQVSKFEYKQYGFSIFDFQRQKKSFKIRIKSINFASIDFKLH